MTKPESKPEKILVGMSGGVDSSVAAALLKEQGNEVTGIYMENWTDQRNLKDQGQGQAGCATWPQDRKDALKVAKDLGIPFRTVSFESEYKKTVLDYFFAEYAAGRTPNPDVLCNREIKFGMLLRWAKDHGFDAVATGHYARVERCEDHSHLYKGADPDKDQSYFLSQLSQEQLWNAEFPLGDWKKPDVRRKAQKLGLHVADKPDSQGLCFVGQIDLKGFLEQKIDGEPGDVRTPDGEVVGRHHGAAFYTVGQRRGVGVVKQVPMYVLKTDVETNTVTVGYEKDLYKEKVATEQPHWVIGEEPEELARGDWRCEVSIRYRMQPAPATVRRTLSGLAIEFDEEQRGPTPGQFAVLYEENELIGSAVIR
ncbi:MAG: tRNA 2-thiouridine(34) synthase MnmA [bacterium]|nr:tRNA 2-thiouridine(34) synthase MnmA [bacterium]MDZ4247959.1 tRNA 2-thiouridine(34) synthase MnmA [Patescibacteria group bacterium]